MKVILDLCGGTGSWSAPYNGEWGYDVQVVSLPQDVRLIERRELPAVAHGVLCALLAQYLQPAGLDGLGQRKTC